MNTKVENSQVVDLSKRDARKQAFRKLLLAMTAAVVGCFALGVFAFGQNPETIQMALDLEYESVPPWKANIEMIVAVVLLGVLAWAVYQLWNFRSSGLPALAVATFAPFFLVQTTASVSTPFVSYLLTVQNVLTGMVLCMGWASPGIFDATGGNAVSDGSTTNRREESVTAE